MSSTLRASLARALTFASASLLVLAGTVTAAQASIEELSELNQRAWAGETELLGQVYAPDAVHTATFYDRTNEYVGPPRGGRPPSLSRPVAR
jgi:HAMP domain-containing protein